jgi:hypothetical protein
MLVVSSETEDEACVGYRAVLIGIEVAAAHGVRAKTKRPSLFEGQVNAATEFVSKGVLETGGSLRREMRIAGQRMGPNFDSLFRGPAEAWTATTEQEPGAHVVLSCVGRCELAISTEPVLPVIHDIEVEAIHALSDVRQFVKSQEGITAVDLPGVALEDAGDVLRRRRGRQG